LAASRFADSRTPRRIAPARRSIHR
jgi:hypothetical protein